MKLQKWVAIVSDSFWPNGTQPAKFLCPLDFPCKNTGVGSYSLLWVYCLACGFFNIWVIRGAPVYLSNYILLNLIKFILQTFIFNFLLYTFLLIHISQLKLNYIHVQFSGLWSNMVLNCKANRKYILLF